MRILILEDDALIAMDIEDIVATNTGAEIVVANTVERAMTLLRSGVDFALLDLHLGHGGQTSLPVAGHLVTRGIPFCFVTASLADIPAAFEQVPAVMKPFRPLEIERALPSGQRRNTLPRYARPETGARAFAPRHQA